MYISPSFENILFLQFVAQRQLTTFLVQVKYNFEVFSRVLNHRSRKLADFLYKALVVDCSQLINEYIAILPEICCPALYMHP